MTASVTSGSKDIPCPFLRALDHAGHIGAQVPIGPFIELVLRAGALRGADALRLRLALPGVAALANGLRNVARNVLHGFRPHDLRQGPLDKGGGGSRIFSQDGSFNEAELQRFEGFGALCGQPPVPGWRMAEIERYLDANQARNRAEGRGGGFVERHVLMEGELPTLLLLLGQGEGAERYLPASVVRALYQDQKLPPAIEERIHGLTVGR